MNSGFYPSVVNHKPRVQTESQGFQPPVYFGGSQVPADLHLPKGVYSGAGLSKSTPVRKVEPIQHQNGKYVVKPYKVPFI